MRGANIFNTARFMAPRKRWQLSTQSNARSYAYVIVLNPISYCGCALFFRLLRLHPHDVEFWIRAVMHELKVVGSMDGARGALTLQHHTCHTSSALFVITLCCAVLMQRALRMNPKSADLWLAYFRLELQCLVRVRHVRDELGMTTPAPPSILDAEDDEEIPAMPTAEPTAEEVERKAAEATFLDGGVARIVFNHAMAALPTQVKLELQLADACVGATDPITRKPLVPKLLAVIIDDMKARFAQVRTTANTLCFHQCIHIRA